MIGEEKIVGKIPKLPSFKGRVLKDTVWDEEFIKSFIKRNSNAKKKEDQRGR